jgi:hypothetical protein
MHVPPLLFATGGREILWDPLSALVSAVMGRPLLSTV